MKQKQQDSTTRRKTSEGLLYEELTFAIIGAFYAVYNALGHGFLESVYRNALVIELQRRGLSVKREVPIEVSYRGQVVGTYRADLVVEDKVLLEIKAAPIIGETERRQVANYVRASRLPVALLLHFGPKPWHKRFLAPARIDQVMFSDVIGSDRRDGSRRQASSNS